MRDGWPNEETKKNETKERSKKNGVRRVVVRVRGEEEGRRREGSWTCISLVPLPPSLSLSSFFGVI